MTIRFARPVHPGEFLREEYLRPLGISAGQLAKALNVPRTRIERLIREETGLTADTALRLARFFDTSPEFWMNFQTSWDLARQARALTPDLDAIERYTRHADAA